MKIKNEVLKDPVVYHLGPPDAPYEAWDWRKLREGDRDFVARRHCQGGWLVYTKANPNDNSIYGSLAHQSTGWVEIVTLDNLNEMQPEWVAIEAAVDLADNLNEGIRSYEGAFS